MSQAAASATPDDTVEFTFRRAEQSGLRLAIKGRLIALILLGLWFGFSRAADPERVIGFIAVLSLFGLLGVFHFLLIGSRFDRSWIKYAFVTLDIAILSALVATQPLFDSAPELPQAMLFRSPIFPYYFVILGIAAFSFSPGMLAWTGAVGAVAWVSAFTWATRTPERILDWGDLPADPNAAQVVAVVLDPAFGGGGGRIQEAVAYLVVALLIAVVMWRARGILRGQIEAERNNAAISGIFGRFVPRAVVDAMIVDQGALAPVEREATVLFADIAGFTELTESAGPAQTVEILNAYFDEVTRIIGDHNGVVTQFQGDAVLATFNVPLADENHAANAFAAAKGMLTAVADKSFAGTDLKIRVGLNTGLLVAGNVGGGGRQSYTVHGDAVNLAARLEAMNKEHGTSLLVSESTVAQLPENSLRRIGDVTVRGLSEPVAIYAAPTSP